MARAETHLGELRAQIGPWLDELPHDFRGEIDAQAGKYQWARQDSNPDLACSLKTREDLSDEFFTYLEQPNDACGTFISLEGQLYGPATIPAGANLGNYAFWAPLEQTFSGEGTTANPYTQVTSVEASGTGVHLIETDRWVEGGSTIDTTYAVSSEAGDTRGFRLYRAADCYVGDSDIGYGAYDPATQTVGCLRTLENGDVLEEQQRPLSPAGATSTEDYYSTIWSDIGSQEPLPESCRCGEEIDDGIATSWTLGLNGPSPVTAASRLAFVSAG